MMDKSAIIDQLTQVGKQENSEPKLFRNKVTEEEIAEVVSKWTGIPVAKMLEGEKEKFLRYQSGERYATALDL